MSCVVNMSAFPTSPQLLFFVLHQFDAAKPEISSFFYFTHSSLACQKPAPTLSTMQLDHECTSKDDFWLSQLMVCWHPAHVNASDRMDRIPVHYNNIHHLQLHWSRPADGNNNNKNNNNCRVFLPLHRKWELQYLSLAVIWSQLLLPIAGVKS